MTLSIIMTSNNCLTVVNVRITVVIIFVVVLVVVIVFAVFLTTKQHIIYCVP